MNDSLDTASFANHFQTIYREKGITNQEILIIYEEDMNSSFGHSCRNWYISQLLGVKESYIINGGLKAWQQENLPVDDKLITTQKSNFQAKFEDSHYYNWKDILNTLQFQDSKLIDVRAQEEWDAYSSSPYGKDYCPRKGRLPNSQHLNWETMLEEKNGVWYIKDKAQVEAEMNSIGVKKDDPIVVYCFKGSRSSATFVALQSAGYNNIKNYFGSCNEWCRDEKLIIDRRKLD